MTDLVQRLRSGYAGFATPVNDMCNDAADRIEMLEAALIQEAMARESYAAGYQKGLQEGLERAYALQEISDIGQLQEAHGITGEKP